MQRLQRCFLAFVTLAFATPLVAGEHVVRSGQIVRYCSSSNDAEGRGIWHERKFYGHCSSRSETLRGVTQLVGHTSRELRAMNSWLKAYTDDEVLPNGSVLVVVTEKDRQDAAEWRRVHRLANNDDSFGRMDIAYEARDAGVLFTEVFKNAEALREARIAKLVPGPPLPEALFSFVPLVEPAKVVPTIVIDIGDWWFVVHR